MKVLIIPEDVPNDQHILKPLFERLLASMGRRRAKVRVSQERLRGVGQALCTRRTTITEASKSQERLRGVGQALNVERIAQIVDRYRGEVRVIVLCVDRDGEVDRRLRLANIEREIETRSVTGWISSRQTLGKRSKPGCWPVWTCPATGVGPMCGRRST